MSNRSRIRRVRREKRERTAKAKTLVATLVDAGLDYGIIAARVGVSERTVYRWGEAAVAPHKRLLDLLVSLQQETKSKAEVAS